eukprot:jgi/Botrbrau1/10548/Bobra.7_1s0024.2
MSQAGTLPAPNTIGPPLDTNQTSGREDGIQVNVTEVGTKSLRPLVALQSNGTTDRFMSGKEAEGISQGEGEADHEQDLATTMSQVDLGHQVRVPDIDAGSDEFKGVVILCCPKGPPTSGREGGPKEQTGLISYQPGPTGARQVLEFRARDVVDAKRPPFGALVTFRVADAADQDGPSRAVQVRLRPYEREAGFIMTVNPKTQMGFILGTKRRSNISFPVSEVKQWRRAHRGWNPGTVSLDSVGIKPGAPVRFTVDEDVNGKRIIAVGLELLKAGSIDPIVHFPGRFVGRICRVPSPPGLVDGLPPNRRNPTRGVIQYTEGSTTRKIDFEMPQLDGEPPLAEDDEVEFSKVQNLAQNLQLAIDLRVVSRAVPRRELGQVRAVKGSFGFINCCERAEDVMFSFKELVLQEGGAMPHIQVGDEVEFTVTGAKPKLTAVRVKKMPPGTALFEVVSEELYVGLIRDPSGSKGTYKSGLLDYYEADGTRVPLIYSPNDLLADDIVLVQGDLVQFRIAIDPLQRSRAEAQGGSLSAHAGRRATQVGGLVIHGVVKHLKPSGGTIQYERPQELNPPPSAATVQNPSADGPGPSSNARSTLNPGAAEFKPGARFVSGSLPSAAEEGSLVPGSDAAVCEGKVPMEGHGPHLGGQKPAQKLKQIRFHSRELHPAAPQLHVGDPVTFIIGTSLNKNGAVDRVAKRVRLEGWVPPQPAAVPIGFMPPHSAAPLWNQEHANGNVGAMWIGAPPLPVSAPHVLPGPEAAYGPLASVGGLPPPITLPAPSPKPRKDRTGRAPRAPESGNSFVAAEVAEESEVPEGQVQGKRNTKASSKNKRGVEKRGRATPPPDLQEVPAPHEPAPKFFTAGPQGKAKERFAKGPPDKDAKGFAPGFRSLHIPSPITTEAIAALWSTSIPNAFSCAPACIGAV